MRYRVLVHLFVLQQGDARKDRRLAPKGFCGHDRRGRRADRHDGLRRPGPSPVRGKPTVQAAGGPDAADEDARERLRAAGGAARFCEF